MKHASIVHESHYKNVDASLTAFYNEMAGLVGERRAVNAVGPDCFLALSLAASSLRWSTGELSGLRVN